MVDIDTSAQSLLDELIGQYADYRQKGEYGSSSFWNWYYQVRNYIYSLDKDRTQLGDNLSFSMRYWGEIIFSRKIVGKDVFVVVTNFRFNQRNFQNWIRRNRPPRRHNKPSYKKQIANWDFYGQSNYDGIYVVRSDTGLYSLADKNKRLLIIEWFVDSDILYQYEQDIAGIRTIGQGLTPSGISYLITKDFRLIHPAAVNKRMKQRMDSWRKTSNPTLSTNITSNDGNWFANRNGYGTDYVSESVIRRIIREEINKVFTL